MFAAEDDSGGGQLTVCLTCEMVLGNATLRS